MNIHQQNGHEVLKNIKVFTLTQQELHDFLFDFLLEAGYDVDERPERYLVGFHKDHYDDLRPCLVSHLDTVFDESRLKDKQFFIDGDQLYCLDEKEAPIGMGADDRAGVIGIMTLINKGYRPPVIFTWNEETCNINTMGCAVAATANLFLQRCDLISLFIELDRKSRNDAVFYDADSTEIMNLLNEVTQNFYKLAYGSFTDICHLSEKSGIGGVNLSIGYYGAHTPMEYLDLNDWNLSMEQVEKLVKYKYDDYFLYELEEKYPHYTGQNSNSFYDLFEGSYNHPFLDKSLYNYDYGYDYSGDGTYSTRDLYEEMEAELSFLDNSFKSHLDI